MCKMVKQTESVDQKIAKAYFALKLSPGEINQTFFEVTLSFRGYQNGLQNGHPTEKTGLRENRDGYCSQNKN